MGVTMAVLGQLETALYYCNATKTVESLQALDEAVALYSGSIEGSVGGSTGVFPFNQARRRCANFKTCGVTGDQIEGNAQVNIEILANITAIKSSLTSGNCTAAREAKEKIAKTIFIPFIQGAIRYGYLTSPAGTAQNPKAEAEGALFAAAVLPVVAKCNETSAAIIFAELKPNSGNTADFSAVKFAFESNYKCMGITCVDVGGLYDTASSNFFAGAGPCNDTAIVQLPPTAAPPRRGFFQRIFDFIKKVFGFLNPF